MLQLKAGSYVSKNHLLKMEYTTNSDGISANIDTGYIPEICLRFLALNKDKRLYFRLETAEGLKREADFSPDETLQNSTVSYRVDFDSFEKASGVIFFFSDLLMRDGLCRFYFGSDDGDVLECGKYNTVNILCRDTSKYIEILEELEIPYTEKLVTAYDTFSKQSPGFSRRVVYKGVSVMDIPEALKMYGLI